MARMAVRMAGICLTVALGNRAFRNIEQHNADPKPFRWTKSADDILASIEGFCVYNAPVKA